LITEGPQAAGSVTFKVGTQDMNATPIALTVSGNDLVATLTVPMLETVSGQMAPGIKTVSAVFHEVNSNYTVSANPAVTNMEITQEDAQVTYTGTQSVATDPKTGKGIVTLRATVQDISAILDDVLYDPFDGDITKAKVRFEVYPANSQTAVWTSRWFTPILVDALTGVVDTVWNAATEGQYSIGIVVGGSGYYLRNSSGDYVTLNVYIPNGDFITGGGYIINPINTAGTYAGDPGRKTNFGFNVKFNKKGTSLQGNMNYLFRKTISGVVHTYQIKSNAMTSLGVDATKKTAVFVSKANLTDITNPLSPVSITGNLTLQVNMTDKGEPGVNDQIAISLWDGSTLVYSSNWTGATTAEMVLGGGNLVVHSSFSVGSMTVKSTDEEAVFVPQAEPGLKVYPIPFKDHLYFDLRIPTDSRVRLEIFDLTGAIIATVFDNNVIADESYFIEYVPENIMNGVFMYRLIVDGKIMYTGKLIRQDH